MIFSYFTLHSQFHSQFYFSQSNFSKLKFRKGHGGTQTFRMWEIYSKTIFRKRHGGTQTFWALRNPFLGTQTFSALRNPFLGTQTFFALRKAVLGTQTFSDFMILYAMLCYRAIM